MCVSYSSPPSHIYREEIWGHQPVFAAGEAARKGSRSVVGPTGWPTGVVGRLVGSTPSHRLWPGSFQVGPIDLGTCLSLCNVGFIALVAYLIHVTTCVALRFVERLYLGS